MSIWGDVAGGIADVATGGLAAFIPGNPMGYQAALSGNGPFGSLVGDITGATSAKDANATNIQLAREAESFSAQQAQKQMDFQERMSNTSYQRVVADMRAAGINPMMAVSNGGASTPSGAAGQGFQAEVSPVPGFYQGLLSTASSVAKTYADVRSGLASASASQALAHKAAVDADVDEKKLPMAETDAKMGKIFSDLIDRVRATSARTIGAGRDAWKNMKSGGFGSGYQEPAAHGSSYYPDGISWSTNQ